MEVEMRKRSMGRIYPWGSEPESSLDKIPGLLITLFSLCIVGLYALAHLPQPYPAVAICLDYQIKVCSVLMPALALPCVVRMVRRPNPENNGEN